MATTTSVNVVVTAATSTPLTGSVSSTAPTNTPSFTPQLGREMYLTLTGTWVGTVQIQRSTNGGTTWNNITAGGGNTWGRYTANCDEEVGNPTDGAALYRLSITLTSGSITYRLAQ